MSAPGTRRGDTLSTTPNTPLRGTLLVVENNATNQKVIQAMLGSLGLDTVMASHGQQAIERLAHGECFDLILMDVHMPVMDGIATTKAIRRHENDRGEPRRIIVALTADAFAEDHERCLKAGMDDFLTKPIDIAALSSVLRRWLAGQDAPAAEPEAKPAPEDAGAVLPAPTFDEAALLDPLGGNRELGRLVVGSALDDLPKYLAQAEQALRVGDAQAAGRLVHTLKGLAAQVGGVELARLAREADARLRQGETLDADDIAPLHVECDALAAALRRWLETAQ